MKSEKLFAPAKPLRYPRGFQALILALFLISAVMARMLSIPEKPFFCDVPANIAAVEKGTMTIQFPGYVPYHLVLKALGWLLGGVFAGAIFFSLLCSLGALAYCVLFAYERAGFSAAVLTLAVAGLSPNAIYFACVGASYTTELLAMSALIYHGNRVLAKKGGHDYFHAVLWFVFGSLMRTVSFPLVGLGLLYLLSKSPTRQHLVFTIAAIGLGAFFYVEISLSYFGSLRALLESTATLEEAGGHWVTAAFFALNVTRNLLFIGWSLNIYIAVILAALWLERRRLDRSLCIFFILLTAPYLVVLLRYIPHAGYICLLLPVLICAPWLVEKRYWLNAKALSLAAIFGIISFLQFFIVKPLPFTGLVSLVLNSYVLTYTYQGIKLGMFDNMTNWAAKTHLREKYEVHPHNH